MSSINQTMTSQITIDNHIQRAHIREERGMYGMYSMYDMCGMYKYRHTYQITQSTRHVYSAQYMQHTYSIEFF